MVNNPLLPPYDTPFSTLPFDQIETEHFLPAIEALAKQTREEVDAIGKNTAPANFENTLEALEKSGEHLGIVSGALFNLNSAETSPELQEVTQKAAPLLTALQNDIRLNADLFARIQSVVEQPQDGLSPEQQTLLQKEYKAFVRNGALLNDSQKEQLRDIDQQLAQLSLQFGEHVLEDTNAFSLLLTKKEEVAGLPESALTMAKQRAEADGEKGWKFTLDYPSYVPFMTYADHRGLRKKMSLAFGQRGFQDNANNNESIVLEIVRLRHERAQLLGYDSHAAFVLEERMAKDESTVQTFLNDLAQKAMPKAQQEWEEMEAYGKKYIDGDSLQKWDTAYLAEKIKQERFAFDEEALKPYFALPQVIEGLFEVVHRLFGLRFIARNDIAVYHPDVVAYEVQKEGNFYAVLYTDFHPRKGKRNGAWMTSYRAQDASTRPHVSIVCNFSPPTQDQPALLNFNEVTTLFHEFGHALHGMLANSHYAALSGTSVSWDFVELPSQLLENWCYEPEALQLFAHHYETGEALPSHFIEKIKRLGQFQQGLQTLRQISFGVLDLSWHNSESHSITAVKNHEVEVIKAFQFTDDQAENCMSTSFSHIFQGGYAAGYYSYKWAEVLDADAFELFKEKGVFDTVTANDLVTHVLSKGGTEDPMTLYQRFRGKAPQPDALLKRSGLMITP